MLDVIVRGGAVFDGSGAPPRVRDVGVADGRIAALGDLSHTEAARVLGAEGLAVAPGFIDVHTHSEYTLFAHPGADSAVRQGVTTHIAGNCGYSCAPIVRADLAKHLIFGFEPAVGLAWSGLGDYFAALERTGVAINVACFAGHGSVRAAAMGLESRPASDREIGRMQDLLAEALDEGAIGISTGLAYPPGTNADRRELTALCEVVARHGGLHATHVRNRDVRYEEGFGEVLELTERTGVPLQISHIVTKHGAPREATHHALEMVEGARHRGLDVACDMLICEWGPGQLTSFLRPEAFEGGMAATLDRLRDPGLRARLRHAEPSWRMALEPDQYHRMILSRAPRTPELVGKSLAELTADSGKDFHDTACDILVAHGEALYDVFMMGAAFDRGDTLAALTSAHCMPESDDVVAAPYGVLARAALTPGCYGWAPQFLAEMVRERRLLAAEEAVRRLTSLPAERFGLQRRGRLAEGYWADVVVCDFGRVASNSTLADFACFPSGIEHVLVNGALVVEHGQHTGALPGQVLRRP
jgi:N-acyl-D-aspartate/D-glutamate deacylase